MTDLILYAALFYVGGGLACYLLWCVAGLTFYARPASPAARTATTGDQYNGVVHRRSGSVVPVSSAQGCVITLLVDSAPIVGTHD